ncbi:MAG: chromate efflux transporter [Dehalococcoidia bacterium]|nr:chromate efflux transporter [Dehalococcoidia bacterium]
MSDRPPGALREVAALFLRLGATAFGGPAAHIALMHDEVVTRRRWIGEQEFLDLLGATNLIPGPNSTELAIHLGHRRAGWRGLVAAGVCFIVPAMLAVLALAWAYVQYGARPQGTWLLYGVKPVVIAIVAHALWRLGRAAIRNAVLAVVGLAVLALYLRGLNEIALLFGGGTAVLALRGGGGLVRRARGRGWAGAATPLLGAPALAAAAAAGVSAYAHATLFLTFLKIGAVLYGSGYVLLAFLRNDFVLRLGWLTEQQLLDAVAIGQFTPGPLFTTATFVGYLLGGVPGALLATLGIFLPAFLFVAATAPLVHRLRRAPALSAALDGVNVAAVGLMAAVTAVLARDALVDWFTLAVGGLAALALLRLRLNPAWLVAAGGLAGLAYRGLAG